MNYEARQEILKGMAKVYLATHKEYIDCKNEIKQLDVADKDLQEIQDLFTKYKFAEIEFCAAREDLINFLVEQHMTDYIDVNFKTILDIVYRTKEENQNDNN